MSATKTVTTLYNPGSKDKNELIQEFVIRLKEFDNIFKDIKTSKMKTPEQHYLLIGQRGSGKSTLIQRLRYAIEDDEQLSKWLIPLAFTEEQYNITELGNLWERISEFLEDYHNMPGIVAALEEYAGNEAKQLDVLLAAMRKHKKKLVLFIDNIGDMLKKFEDVEVKRLREVLQTIPDIRLIAASPLMLDSILDHQSALFEFFKTIRLSGLNKEEIETLLLKLGEQYNSKEAIERIIKDSPERIEILRRLTGGVVRTVVMMFNVFVENTEGNPIGDLNSILDDATPLYKHKMDDLPKQQQKIVDAVMRNWEAITSGEIAEKLRMDSKQISAQLRQLEKDQWIEKIETSTKNNLYQAKERFFNIWYLMRYGRRFDKTRVIWLVKFMESWLEKNEIEARINKMILKIRSNEIDEGSALLWAEIYWACETISPLSKIDLIIAAENHFLSGEIKKLIPKSDFNDVFLHPDRLNKKDLEFISTLFIDNEGNVDFEIDCFGILRRIYSSQNVAVIDFWRVFLEQLKVKDKLGFVNCLKFSLLFDVNMDMPLLHLKPAVDKGNLFAIFLEGMSSFSAQVNKDEIVSRLDKVALPYRNNILYLHLSATLYLWANRFEDANTYIDRFFTKFLSLSTSYFGIQFVDKLLILILAKYQYNILFLILDKSPEFKEKNEPIYYALMHYMKDEYPNEYLRMPPEMKETVEDVIKKVEEYRVKYA